MADNVPITAGTGTDVATDDVGGVHFQKTKIDLGGDGVSSPLVRGQQTKANSIPVTHASDDTVALATGSKVQLSDGTSDATVRNLAANDALNVAIVDGSGNHVTSFAGSGGTSSTDDADFTALTTPGTPIMGVRQDTPRTVTNEDMGVVKIDTNGRLEIAVGANSLDVAHDSPDSGLPAKVGGKALSAMQTAVTTGDRTNANYTLYGQALVAVMDPAMQVWKQVEATTAQTGTAIWTPAGGKKIAITSYQIGTTSTTAGVLTVWFGASADTTFTQGTDQVVFRGNLVPSATGTPGVIANFGASPIFCVTADHVLRYTTVGDIDVYITVYGYEF